MLPSARFNNRTAALIITATKNSDDTSRVLSGGIPEYRNFVWSEKQRCRIRFASYNSLPEFGGVFASIFVATSTAMSVAISPSAGEDLQIANSSAIQDVSRMSNQQKRGVKPRRETRM